MRIVQEKKAPRKREEELTKRDRGMPSEARVVISHLAQSDKDLDQQEGRNERHEKF